MGCKMVKGNGLALLILIFIFMLVPVSCENNSSINATQSNAIGNVSGSDQPSSDSVSKTTDITPNGASDGLSFTDTILSIIASLLAIALVVFKIIPRLRMRKKKSNQKSDTEEISIPPGSQKEISNSIIKMPLPNPNFTGRQKFLSTLSQSLLQATTSPKIFALVGNGGMGKTQIALQHAHDPKNDFKYVWWLRSEEPATLLEDYIIHCQGPQSPRLEFEGYRSDR